MRKIEYDPWMWTSGFQIIDSSAFSSITVHRNTKSKMYLLPLRFANSDHSIDRNLVCWFRRSVGELISGGISESLFASSTRSSVTSHHGEKSAGLLYQINLTKKIDSARWSDQTITFGSRSIKRRTVPAPSWSGSKKKKCDEKIIDSYEATSYQGEGWTHWSKYSELHSRITFNIMVHFTFIQMITKQWSLWENHGSYVSEARSTDPKDAGILDHKLSFRLVTVIYEKENRVGLIISFLNDQLITGQPHFGARINDGFTS